MRLRIYIPTLSLTISLILGNFLNFSNPQYSYLYKKEIIIPILQCYINVSTLDSQKLLIAICSPLPVTCRPFPPPLPSSLIQFLLMHHKGQVQDSRWQVTRAQEMIWNNQSDHSQHSVLLIHWVDCFPGAEGPFSSVTSLRTSFRTLDPPKYSIFPKEFLKKSINSFYFFQRESYTSKYIL